MNFPTRALALAGALLAAYTRQKSHEEPLGGAEAAKLAMWAYLGSECLIFGGLISNMVYLLDAGPHG